MSGFVTGAVADYEVASYERFGRWTNGLDAFLAALTQQGLVVPDPTPQPPSPQQYGGGGVLDLFATRMQLPYARIVHPPSMLPTTTPGSAYPQQNAVLLAASTLAALEAATDSVRHGSPPVGNVAAAYLRGRTVVRALIRTVRSAAAEAVDLFAALAAYTEVSTPLLALLAGLRDWEHAGPDQRDALTTGLNSFATLAEDVAAAWAGHWGGTHPTARQAEPAAGDGPTPDVYVYRLRLHTDGEWYTTLRLNRSAESGPGGVGWPETIHVTDADGVRYELTRADDADCGCSGADCRCYRFPPRTAAAFTLLTFELTLPPVHVADCQNASASVWVTRNEGLLGEGRPDTAAPAFVYRTPEVAYPRPIVPFIEIASAIPIAPWPQEPLPQVFAAIGNGAPAGRPVAIGARYGYTLVGGAAPVTALLPVVQSTVRTYEDGTVPTLTATVNTWREREQPATEDGAWVFQISMYSALDPDVQRPLLRLKSLSSPLASGEKLSVRP